VATIEVNGEIYNAQDVCEVPKCTNRSSARMIEPAEGAKGKRRDLCFRHVVVMQRVYKDAVEVIATWNGYSMEDF
jgi:hypothetical protein